MKARKRFKILPLQPKRTPKTRFLTEKGKKTYQFLTEKGKFLNSLKGNVYMDSASVKRVIVKYAQAAPQKIIERQLEVGNILLDKAIVIVGPRRAGKSFFLYSLFGKHKGFKEVFVNFEDNLLAGLDSKGLNLVLDCSIELYGTGPFVFFLDEMQVVDGWERFVVSLLNSHFKVFVTGSNSKLLGKEIATSLRGKALPFLLLPFSFKEFLNAKGFALDKNTQYSEKIFELKRFFFEYMEHGGFPEIVLSDSTSLKNLIVNNYFDSVVYKDIVDRLGIKNTKLVEITIKYLLNLFGHEFSVSAFENYLKSNKFPYSLEDVYTILGALRDVFFISFVKHYSKSFKKSEFSKSKVYAFDTSYIHFLSNSPKDFGRILENIVFIELFRREGHLENRNVFYYRDKNNSECDFVVVKREKPFEAIQVAYLLDEKDREREIKGMLSAMSFFGLENGLILTFEQEEEIAVENKKIKVMPVWKWLLPEMFEK